MTEFIEKELNVDLSLTRNKTNRYVFARCMAYYAFLDHMNMSFSASGEVYKKTHATVMHSYKNILPDLRKMPKYARVISKIDEILSKTVKTTILSYVENLNVQYELKDNATWGKYLPSNLKSEKFIVNKYSESQEYKWHIDQIYNNKLEDSSLPRLFSVVIYLNDNFDGGETQFQFTSVKPQKGACLIFPSNFMFSHCARPVKNGVKYSVASWLAPLDEEDI